MKTKISHLGRSTVSVILAVMMLLSTMLVGTITTVSAYDISQNVTIYYANTENWSSTPNLYYWGSNWNSNVDLENISNTGIYKKTFSDKWSNLSGFIIRNGKTWGNGQTKEVYANVSQNTYFYGTNDTPNTNLSQLNGTAKVINMVSVDNGTSYNELASGCVTTVSGYNLPTGAVSTTAVSSSTSSASSNASIEAAFGSTITYSATADSNYEFKGFSTTNSSSLPNNLNTKATMTQTSSAINGDSNDVYYAYYVAKNIQTPVAESVSLEASPETVTSGGSSTLTATLTGKAVSDVTLTLTGGETPQTATVKGSDTTATFTVSPTSTTTYTVTASAVNYSSKSATATVNVTVPDTYYLWTSDSDDVTNASAWTPTELTYSDDGSYVGNVIFPKNGSNYFFTINKSPNSVKESSIWSSKNEVKENLSSTETSGFTSAIAPQDNNGCYFARVAFEKENTDVKFTFTPKKTVVISRNSSTPVGDVTINVTNVVNATVTAKSDNETADEGGSLTVAKGSTFEVTVTPDDGYEITGIIYNNETKKTSPATFTAAVSGDITVTVNKPTEATPFMVAYGKERTLMEMVATKNKGIYISTAAVANATTDKLVANTPNAQFTIYDTAKNQYAFISASGNYYWLKDNNLSITMGAGDYWKDAYDHGEKKGLINNACKSPMYVVYNANTKTITLTGDRDYGTKATLYVKNGTYSTSFENDNTKEYAQSSVAAGLNATKTDPCNTYSVSFDTNVNVQTTLTDKYRKAGYYVGAYCVNGRNYPASAKNADQGIYQANITITEDLAENCVVEVTPVYYNRTIEEDNNYITLYVDADQATKDWGSTISVDAYSYKNGDKTKGELHAFGTYPGQPMVKDGQYYVIKVPRYYYEVSADGTLTIDTNSPISGVTLNNYNNEKIHGSLVPIKRNMQTYDFSDFVALANKEDVKTIMFQSKFYNATGDANRNTSVVFKTAGEIKNLNPKSQISNIGDAATIKVNPYEDFTDYYGRATDAIGNLLNDDQKADKDNLYIISTGSYNNQSAVYSTKGQWVTIWNVYDHNGNLITYGTPADFLDENTSQYKKIADNYKGKPVKISYEKGLLYNDGTSRTDGRWYYSTLGQEFTSDVAIEYKHQNDKVYTADIDSNADNNTGFVGETTKATATINNVTTASFSSVTDTAHLNIKVANGWRFDGWFIKQGDKYTEVSDNYTDISTDILMSNRYHIVARVSQIPTGTLELNHTAYTGTDPAAHKGTGFYYISAVLYDQTGAVKHSYAETQGKISIDDFAATDSLEITLRAVAHGDNTIYAVYKGIDAGYFKIGDKDYEGDPSFSYTFKVSADSLFKGDELAVNALNYYTDIVKVGGTCDITYMYNDRFGVEGEGKMVSYVVRNVELSTYEITHDYIPTDETITKYAPRIDTMYVETKWNLTDTEKVKKGRSQATVIATQTDKTCKVYHPTLEGGYYTDIADSTPYEVHYNTLLMDDNGDFFLSAPETDVSGNQFSYWNVYKADKNGSKTELVTKCYERNFGLRIMADYYIEPVYGENAPKLTANINAPVLNREIYGDSANPKDKLYADLLTAFTSTAIPTFKENKTDLKVECGVFVVRNNTSTLSVDDRNTLVNAAATGGVDTTSDILAKKYKMIPQVETEVKSQLGKLAVDSAVKNNTNNTYKFGSDDYRVTKFVFDNDSLTNKNRIDKVLRYTNNTANQNYIFTAYAFVVIKDSNGEVKDMCISESQYFNLCYVGNKALDNN